ncbi:DUF4160 domain-containing protein [Calidithermus terrae]|uniref:DUF4160 domain-containing protein n=1 Tax=Calidithermus terrae TaxID=1408545 RepID=UPI000E658E1B|nr:DUF4160 domain-containing protein [Calidithermus terrae]
MPSRRIGGFRIVIYPNDHRPPHVHVMTAGGEVLILLGLDGEAVEIREIRGAVKNGDAVRAIETVSRNNDSLLEWWREIHGDC